MNQIRGNKNNLLFLLCVTVLTGCMAGPMSIAMDKETITTYDTNGRIVSVAESNKINQPIAKSTLATVSFLSTDSPIAGAIVAGANSIGEGIGKIFDKSGDAVGGLTTKSQGSPIIIQNPQSYPIGTPRPIPEPIKK